MAVEPLSRADEMTAFYAEINQKGLDALWRHQGPPGGGSGPRAPFAPYLWRWSMVRPYMQRTAELVRPGEDAERRVLTLNNPTALPMQSTTHTISAAVQLVLPGERAPSHRHTMAAIRWVLEGDGAMTFVDGEPCSMHPGDLILTPGWSWHGHLNETSSPMLWMDSLDVPLVRTLRAELYQEYPGGEFQETNRQVDESLSRYGAGHLRAVWDRGARPISPLLSFPWAQTERALHDLARVETSPYDDVAFQFTNPSTGGHVLPTIGCWVQMLRPGVHTQAHRHNTVAVYQVFRGRGSTIVDGVQIDWQQGDFISLPPWAWHEHVNGSSSEEVVLFSTNDIALYEAINLYREEPYTEHGGHQPVVASYEERYERASA